jgi:hypothetical protein
MTVRSGRTTSADHIYKDMWQTKLADHVRRPHQQGHMAEEDNDKCQVELTLQVRANHESE